MIQIDIHSHRLHANSTQLQFLSLEASLSPEFMKTLELNAERAFLSVGVHPRNALKWEQSLLGDLFDVFSDQRIALIGEIGLDKVCSVPIGDQRILFEAQIGMAERLNKPVILHVVHAMSEVMAVKKLHPDVPAWIIHGFRGGKQEAEQYAAKGFYLSFGPKYDREGLLACPFDRIFLETDESKEDLGLLYLSVSTVLQCPVKQLESQIERNFRAVFPKLL